MNLQELVPVCPACQTRHFSEAYLFEGKLVHLWCTGVRDKGNGRPVIMPEVEKHMLPKGM